MLHFMTVLKQEIKPVTRMFSYIVFLELEAFNEVILL